MGIPARVRIVDVSPRDGLQNEPAEVSTEVKVGLIRRLAAAGVPVVEATSFVSPRWIPQLADAAEVMAALPATDRTRFPVLVPNLQGLERAVAAGAKEVAVFTAASETFNRKNINASIADSLERLGEVAGAAREHGIDVRGYVSCALGCPYEGAVATAKVVAVARALVDLGCYEVSLGDTIGVGTPVAARALLSECASAVGMERLAVHFHDTRGQALANVFACLELGVATVDASVAGLGGCPYAKGATGNVATEDLVYLLHGVGAQTGIDLPALVRAGHFICDRLGRRPNSRLGLLPEYREAG